MSHVDEGLLHAYLDGAFASGDAQGVEIETHLASCADCRARLEEARELKDRAREVLQHATPIDVHVPPFDVLRARKPDAPHAGAPAQRAAGESSRSRRLARPQVQLAWAASVVLAVSAGWMANELVRRDTGESAAVQDAPRAPRPEPVSRLEADARNARARSPVAASRERQTGGAAVAPRLAQVDSPPPPAAVPVAPTEASPEAAPLARTAEKLADRDADREPVPAIADILSRRARVRVEAGRVATDPGADATSLDLTQTANRPSDAIALANGSVLAGHVALLSDYTAAIGSGLWSPTTAEQAAAALGGQPAGIENLRPTEIGTAVVDGRVLVSQRYRLDGGAQLELIQRSAAAPLSRTSAAAFQEQSIALPHVGVAFKSLAESLEMFRGESVVAASRPGLVLLLKGPVSRDSLHAFTARIR